MKVNLPKALRHSRHFLKRVRRDSRSPVSSKLLRLKDRLIQPHLAGTHNPLLRAGLERAATEAEALAWFTPYPLLVLPELLEEKAREARQYVVRQAALREASREWLSLAE